MQKYSILLVLILLSTVVFSQVEKQNETPKIGLVLSGGGAKGLAHVGVLEVLEQAGITPDYITGTSMGGIIGSFYAMGYSVNEISEIVKSIDWGKILSDDLPLDKIVMDEKYESKRYLFHFPIRNYKLKLPSGFIEGQMLEAKFAEKTWPLSQDLNFDSLPIPFHCMSVDLYSGETIEHTNGNLSEAIRASMAIPSIIAPEKIDTLLLVDGGITKNFPVQEVIDMGADIVIGVYVGFNDKVSGEDMFSFSDILTRSVSLAGIVDSRMQAKKVDVLITPDLKGLTSADFLKAQEIVQYGKESALEMKPQLIKIIDSLNLEFKPIKPIERPEKIKISKIEVQDLRFLSNEFVVGNSGLKPGNNYSQPEIAKAIESLYGTQYFSKVTYALKKQAENYVLVIRAKEKTRAFVNLAPAYESERGVGLATNLTLRNWGIPESHFIFTANIAENPGIRTMLTKYWGRKHRLMNFYFFNANIDKLPYYKFGTERGFYSQQSGDVGIGVKYSIGLNQQFGAKALYEYLAIKPNTSMKLLLPETAFNSYGLSGFALQACYSLNTTDHLYFPTKGVKFDAVFKRTFASNVKLKQIDTLIMTYDFASSEQAEFNTLFAHFSSYHTLANRITFNFQAYLGLNSTNAGVNGNFILGGMHIDKRCNFVPLAGFNFGEILASNFASVHGNLDVEIFPKFYISLNSNVALTAKKYDKMPDYLTSSTLNDYYIGFNAGVQYYSPIGPLKLFVGDNSSNSQTTFYFSIGYPF